MINYVLPSEILKKIFELLDIKSLCSARQTCKYWNEIIVAFELVEEAASKIKPYICVCYAIDYLDRNSF